MDIDLTDKLEKTKKYGKYLILVIFILIIFLIIKACHYDYNDVEDQIIELAKDYIKTENITINNETYIELTKLDEVEGTELCSKASGVIVNNSQGKLNYSVYLSCPDYQSDIINNKQKYIELYDSEVVLLNKGEAYKEAGYYNKKGVIIEEVTNVKSEPGIYTVYYKAYENDELKETAVRKVIVSTNDKYSNISGLSNKEEPSLNLLGDSQMIISKGERYVEPGYFAIDYEDGKISRKVEVTGNVNTNVTGSYLLTYRVTNSKGNSAIATRKVTIVNKKSNLDISLTSENEINNTSNINISINGSGYNYTILPNGNKELKNNFVYEATENKTYTFKIYDIYNNEIVRDYNVTNLDKTSPTGSCNAVVSTKSVNITVNASDNKGISSYTYFVNSNKINTLESNNYNNQGNYSKENVPNVKVEVKDVAGNKSTITCNNILELSPNTYKDINGYDCLEPFICYKQKDYSDPYQATINGVGTIYRSGCLPTSLTIISTKFNRKSKSGDFYTPPTLIKEIIYPDGKIKGYSNYKRVTEVAAALNLKISQEYKFNSANLEILLNHLKTGNPALLLVSSGCYTTGGHYMAILGINEEGKVFLSDPYMRGTTSMTGKCSVNTWVDINDIKNKGGAREFVLFSE